MSPLFYAVPAPHPLALPFPEVLIRAGVSGFPSPAQDYEGRALDLNERFVKRPSATFFTQVQGDSMEHYGMYEGDVLIVDRSVDTRPGQILVVEVEGEMIVKRYELINGQPYLCSGNPRYAPIPMSGRECQVWGVVRSVIHEFAI